jgi:3-hydroxyacyl-CoA dehydrogenase
VADDAALIQQANYEEHLHLLGECDLVIEAIAERMDWKLDLYKKIAPHVAPHAIVASNTSGLSITKLSEALPDSIKPRFCGIHFFNPPRYMYLVELIATPTTQPQILDDLETFVVRPRQGRGARQGHAQLHRQPRRHRRHAGDDEGGRELRPVVRRGRRPHRQEAGARVQRHLPHRGRGGPGHDGARDQDAAGHLSADTDPFYASFGTPEVLKTLLEMGNLGQKTKAGFYKKVGRDVLRFELESKDYVPGGQKADEVYGRMLAKPAGRAPEAAAQRRPARRASSCGPSCATASTTPPCTWRRSPRRRATSTSPCAGASA